MAKRLTGVSRADRGRSRTPDCHLSGRIAPYAGIVAIAVGPVVAVDELEAVYRQDGDRLWRALYAFAGNEDVASDAVAEAFAQALRRGAAIRDKRSWVWRSAFRLASGELKRRSAFRYGSMPEGAFHDVAPGRAATRRPTRTDAATACGHRAALLRRLPGARDFAPHRHQSACRPCSPEPWPQAPAPAAR